MNESELSQSERKFVSVLRGAKLFAPTILQVAGSAAIASVALPAVANGGAAVALVSGGAMTTIAGLVWSGVNERTRARRVTVAEDEAASLRAALAVAEAHLGEFTAADSEYAEFMLGGLLQELGLDDTDHRASLFVRSGDGDSALIGRYSQNATFRTPGRSRISGNEGAVARAWKEKRFHHDLLPATRSKWEETTCRLFGLLPEHARNLRMQSRSYLGLRISRREGAIDRPIGVVLLESLRPKGLQPAHQDQLEGHWTLELMSTLCASHERLEKRLRDARLRQPAES